MSEPDAARSLPTSPPSGGRDLNLMESMAETRSVVAELADDLRGHDLDAVVTWENIDDVVIGFGVALALGIERACVREDLGKLLTTGPDLHGARVATLALAWDQSRGRDVLRNALTTAGATVAVQTEVVALTSPAQPEQEGGK